MVSLRSVWPWPFAVLGGLFGWLQPMPSIPPGHDGLCRTETASGVDYIVCDVPLSRYAVNLRAVDASGRPYSGFETVRQSVGDRRIRLIVNAGMYHEDRQPVGLAIEDGRTIKQVVRGTGSGNFSLQPNGVFLIENGRASVVETGRYLAGNHSPQLATQSGPMLLVDGELHPRFIENSDSRFVRNGVCAVDDGKLVRLVLSRQPVNFWDFAVFFRDRLDCRDALFFDGKVSSLYYPDADIDYQRDRLGPMLVVTDEAE